MAAPKYGNHFLLGAQLKACLENPDGACPIPQCTLVAADEERYRVSEDSTFGIKDRSDVYLGPLNAPIPFTGEDKEPKDAGPHPEGPYAMAWTHMDRYAQLFTLSAENCPQKVDQNGAWNPYYAVGKWDPIESFWKPEERDNQIAALKRQHGDPLPKEFSEVQCWDGVIGKGMVAIEYVKRNHGEPPMSEVTNALYSKHFPDDDLKWVFVHDIRNTDTRSFITTQLFSPENGWTWPPNVGVSKWSMWAFGADTHPAEYTALLGTKIGKMIGRWMLGRYPRGSCTIPVILLSLSGDDTEWGKDIDMCFYIVPTKPPIKLPDPAKAAKGAGKDPGPKKPPPKKDPVPIAPVAAFHPSPPLPAQTLAAVLAAGGPDPKMAAPAIPAAAPAPPAAPVPPAGGKPAGPAIPAAAPVPPAGGKPVGAAIAAAAPVPPPGGKPIGAAIAALPPPPPPPTPAQLLRAEKKKILKRKAKEDAEKEEKERDELYGKTRSGKRRKKD